MLLGLDRVKYKELCIFNFLTETFKLAIHTFSKGGFLAPKKQCYTLQKWKSHTLPLQCSYRRVNGTTPIPLCTSISCNSLILNCGFERKGISLTSLQSNILYPQNSHTAAAYSVSFLALCCCLDQTPFQAFLIVNGYLIQSLNSAL